MSGFGDLTLAQLELFVRIADAGSLSAAARQSQITPATASASLKRLERVLGVRLIERSTRSMRLTDEGELLRDHAGRALGVIEDARALLGEGRETLVGDIHIGAPSDLGRGVLSRMLTGFLARHPGVRLTVHASDRMHDLLRDRVDLAVRYGELADSSLVARHLYTTTHVLIASPAYLARHGEPTHPSELSGHNCLALYRSGRPQATWVLHDGTLQCPVRVRGDRVADDGALVRQWATEGLGIALKAHLDVIDDLRDGRLQRVLPGWVEGLQPLHALMPTGRYVPLRVRRLLDHLIASFGEIEPPVDIAGR